MLSANRPGRSIDLNQSGKGDPDDASRVKKDALKADGPNLQ
jgi:hypothetical protein